MRKIFFLFVFSFCAIQSFAQLEKVLHQTIDVDSINTIQVDIKGDVEIEIWVGNTILTETSVQLYDATPGIFKHFIETEKRYEVVSETNNSAIRLYSFDSVRNSIRTKRGECFESVKVKVYIPDVFEVNDNLTMTRKIESN